MTTLKRSNLASFIQRERDLLTILWDKLYLSPTQRATLFPPILISILPLPSTPTLPSPNISEELLIAHERERVRAEEEVERMKGVLGRLERYFGVVEEMRELEISALDPGRLLGKATRGDPGRLLREEKARKRVGKEKPKVPSLSSSLHPFFFPLFFLSSPNDVLTHRIAGTGTSTDHSGMGERES